MRERFDVIYCECWGDIADVFDKWLTRRGNSTSPTVTYSSQFFDFVSRLGARTYALSGCQRPAQVRAHGIAVTHHRRRISRLPLIGYHLEQLRYALLLFGLALRYRPRVMFVDSGVTYWIFLIPLRLLGIRIIAVLHNSLWPNGFPPMTIIGRLRIGVDRIFFRHFASAVFCVSPVIRRQVLQLLGGRALPIIEFGASFDAQHYHGNYAAPSHSQRPFQVFFAGRIERNKGVFDLLEAAQQLESADPGRYVYDICGGGGDADELAQRVGALGLSAVFRLHGRLDRDALIRKYLDAHVVVVPTRSDFCEGYAQVVAEAVLLGRPVITNSIVPAMESLVDAVVEARPDDVTSLAASIKMLADDNDLFSNKRAACLNLREKILDRRHSFLNRLLDHRDLLERDGRLGAAE
jgi:glycogen synthase